MYCSPKITESRKFNVEKIRPDVFSVITVYDHSFATKSCWAFKSFPFDACNLNGP